MSNPRPLRPVPIASARRGVDLLSRGLNRDILGELAVQGPLTRMVLTARLHAGSTRLYEGLKDLRQAGLIVANRRGRAPTYSLTPSGSELRQVSLIVEHWFASHPGRALEPSVGWRAFTDLGEAWRLGIVEWIVRRVPTPDGQGGAPAGFDPNQLAETLERMSEAGIVTLRRTRGRNLYYGLTPWAARAIGPLASIARWEQRHQPPGSAAIEVDDAVVAILATLPLVRLSAQAEGTCTFTADAGPGERQMPRSGTVWVRLRGGRAVRIGEGAAPDRAVGWASGSFAAWLAAALDGRNRELRLDGRDEVGISLVGAAVSGMHVALTLFGG